MLQRDPVLLYGAAVAGKDALWCWRMLFLDETLLCSLIGKAFIVFREEPLVGAISLG